MSGEPLLSGQSCQKQEVGKMTQAERRLYLIDYFLKEAGFSTEIPTDEATQKRLLRALMNVRAPQSVDRAVLNVQNAYLQQELCAKGITDIDDLTPVEKDIYLWKGDITTLKCDAIVNAANSGMLGCFYPCHDCIDNAIHTFAGIQLRLFLAEVMKKQGYEEPTGRAKLTEGYNLPCRYILHTVGPFVRGKLTEKDRDDLANCYLSCLNLADQTGIRHLAFCCLSTGEFHFPNDIAASIAVQTVRKYKKEQQSEIKVIFNVFKEKDYEIYQGLFGANR